MDQAVLNSMEQASEPNLRMYGPLEPEQSLTACLSLPSNLTTTKNFK